MAQNWEKKAIFEVAVTVFKVKSKLFPDLFKQFPTNNEISQNSYTTRQQHNLYVSRTNTDHGARSFIVLGPEIWNPLPDNVTNSHLTSLQKKTESIPYEQRCAYPLNIITLLYTQSSL